MKKNIMIKQISLTALVLCTSFSASAGMFSWLGGMIRESRRVDTLVVTGNYVKPRLLAELIQHRIGQPILLVNRNEEGLLDLYYMPIKPKPNANRLNQEELIEFTDLVNPKRVVIVGDTKYVPIEIRNLFLDRYPTQEVTSPNWAINAEALAVIFDYPALPGHFAKLLKGVMTQQQSGQTGGVPQAME